MAEVPTRCRRGSTADSRYVLWVNGREVGRGPGPVAAEPAALRQLRPGAVPGVRHRTSSRSSSPTTGRPTRSGSPRRRERAPTRCSSSRRASGDDELVSRRASGARSARAPGRWRRGAARPAKACRSRSATPASSRAGGNSPASTTRDWSPAAVIATQHIGGLARSRPPTLPLRAPAPARASRRSAGAGRARAGARLLEPARSGVDDRPPGRARDRGAAAGAATAARDAARAAGDVRRSGRDASTTSGWTSAASWRASSSSTCRRRRAPSSSSTTARRRSAPSCGCRPDPATGARYVAAGDAGRVRRGRAQRPALHPPRRARRGRRDRLAHAARGARAPLPAHRRRVLPQRGPGARRALPRRDPHGAAQLARRLHRLPHPRAARLGGRQRSCTSMVRSRDERATGGWPATTSSSSDSPRPTACCRWSSSARSRPAAA